jgi:cell division protein FtsI (penicillin-binding protein 3)
MVVVMAAAIGARLYQLQISMCERFRIRASDQHHSSLEVPAVRGSILDRHGNELAVSLETHSLYAHPQRIDEPEQAAASLAPILDLSRGKLLKLLRQDKKFVYLKRCLSPSEVEAIRALDLPMGSNEPFGFEPQHKRSYPNDRLAVHVVGFANIDGDGAEGIEKVFDEELKGDPAVYLALQDAHNNQIRQLVRAPEEMPHDIVLTIDMSLQHAVERELNLAMRETRARAASAVLIDPATGQILALANRPAANPNEYGRAKPSERINRAVVHYYEPGSTFKFVPMAAALDRGTVRRSQWFDCENGCMSAGRRMIRDISPEGMLTPDQILAKSSNIGMVKITRSLSPSELRESILKFGFATETGVELPGETPGILVPVEEWSALTRDSLAFGQEIGVTALQMASALATIANDGVMVPPRIVLGTLDPDGLFHGREAPAPKRVLSSDAARKISSMLEGVVEYGTGRRAAVAGYRIAGKSGTAQKAIAGGGYSETDFFASFGGFGPLPSPRIAGLVLLDSPSGKRHQGGYVAAPVFGRIITEALYHLRVPPQPSKLSPSYIANGRAPASSTAKPRKIPKADGGTVPDVRGMSLRDATAALSSQGCRVRISGDGYVAVQRPAAGEKLADGATCYLRLSSRSVASGRRAG